jgi:hypothetical protein
MTGVIKNESPAFCDQIIANLNAYSLFGSNETLMEMIARRELT